jgi:ankyrin repeat protein
MKRLLLIILTGLALACPARAGQFWDLFSNGQLEEAKALIVKHPELINTHEADDKATPLHLAARFGTPELVLFFIQKGADVNARDESDFTPLHEAATAEIAKVLIAHGADTTLKDGWGNTPLQMAAETAITYPDYPSYAVKYAAQYAEVCGGMLKAGAKLDILSALYLGKREEAMKMVAADPRVLREHENVTSLRHNVTPLGIAAEEGDKEMVELFLKNGAPVDGATKAPDGDVMTTPGGIQVMTPLSNALFSDHPEVAEILLKAGASPDAVPLEWVDEQSDAKIKELVHRYLALRPKK